MGKKEKKGLGMGKTKRKGESTSRRQKMKKKEKTANERFMICCGLPENVEVEIMSRLPVESLMRFQCVSKSWYSLINALIRDPKFVAKHLHNMNNALSNKNFIVSKCSHHYIPPRTWLAMLTILNEDDVGCNQTGDIVCFYTMEIGFPIWDMSFVEVHHCNGLICLVDMEETIMLSNPVLEEYVLLPQTDYVRKYDYTRLGLGFGYDSRADDYKIVRILGDCLTASNVIEKKAEVYSLSTNSWREVQLPISDWSLRRLCSEVYCKGAYYWVTFALEDVLLCFDMCDDEFYSIPLPDEFISSLDAYWRSRILNWNDSVALFYFSGEREQPATFEMWVMNESSDGVKSSCSWTKHLTIGPLVDISHPIAFWSSDELFMVDRHGDYISYNISNQKLKGVATDTVNDIAYQDYYMRTFVSIRERMQV